MEVSGANFSHAAGRAGAFFTGDWTAERMRTPFILPILREVELDHEFWHRLVAEVHVVVDSKIECCPSANAVLENAGLAKRF